MLNHLLAGIVALGSLVLFLSGFFFPEVQRKPDLAWSGVALLYALLLFAEGDRTSGGALLGHIASVALILWFGWQTLQQRRQYAAVEEQTAIPDSLEALTPFLKEGWGRIAIAYGEASSWVQEQLGKDDTNMTPEALTQQSQDWDDPSTDLESDDAAVAVASEPTLKPDDEAVAVVPEPTLEPTTAPEATPIPTVAADSEPSNLESPAPSTSEEVSESRADSSEPEQSSSEPASSEPEVPVASDEASEIDMESVTVAAHPESAPLPTTASEKPPSEIEPVLSASEAQDAAPHEPPVTLSEPEDDGSWPPPELEA